MRPMITRHQIRNEAGRLLAVHARRDSPNGEKTTWWEQPDGTKGLDGTPVTTLPLYGSEKLKSLPTGAKVVVTEGEKATDTLIGREIPAVGSVTGASGTPCDSSLRALLPYYVILWPDADPAGRGHMARIAERLRALGHSEIHIIEWADAPLKGDAADFMGDAAELTDLIASAPPYELPAPVNLRALLDDLLGFIRRYVVLNDQQADATALWVVHTHCFGAAEATPYLSITSPEKRSGKTRLLEALELLVARPWLTGRVSAAALVRTIEKDSPTLLLDEADVAFNREREYTEAIRGILNDGYRSGKQATLCIPPNWEPARFSVFCPKAIASIGRLPDTVMDRSIVISLRRRASNEPVGRFRFREAQEETAPVRDRLMQWAAAGVGALTGARPEIPPELDDRAADGWEPLLAIADTAGGEWPEKARRAALALSVGPSREDDSLGVRLLRDIHLVFAERREDRVTSAVLAKALVAIEEAPWGDVKGKSLDARALAWRLRPYGVRPRKIRVGEKTIRGYDRADFADAWRRYTPELTGTGGTSGTADTCNVPDVPDVPLSSGIHGAASDVLSLPYDDGRRLYTYSLAEILSFPHISLGEREINGSPVSVGVPRGRFAWEQAVRFWPSDMVGELIETMEEICK